MGRKPRQRRRGKSKGRFFLGRGGVELRLYTLNVFLLSGPFGERYARKNKVVSRTILIRNTQTLQDLHYGFMHAFRYEEHEQYEFHFSKGPMNPEAYRYVLPAAFAMSPGEPDRPTGQVDQARVDSLGLEVGDRFSHWSDHCGRWWHLIIVEAIENGVPQGELPRTTKRVGKNPPRYPDSSL